MDSPNESSLEVGHQHAAATRLIPALSGKMAPSKSSATAIGSVGIERVEGLQHPAA
jgi:hypothetical protein